MKFFSFLDLPYPPPDWLGQKITVELSIAQSAVNDLRLKKLRHMDVPMNAVQRHSFSHPHLEGKKLMWYEGTGKKGTTYSDR